MCVVSMIMDHYDDEWRRKLTAPPPTWVPMVPYTVPNSVPHPAAPTQQEIEEFRRLLERAREYDKKNNEPDCELVEKRQKILKLAEELGIKVDFV